MGISIKADNLTKKYDKKILFENLSLDIKKNEMVAIMGKSGSGKTTLINMLGLIEPCSSGEISYDNKIIKQQDNRQVERLLQNKIGYLFQNFALMNEKTVLDNLKLALPKKVSNKKEKILEALNKVNLAHYLDEKVYHLSGGEQQRVAIARLFLKPCDVVFADEPTGSLDEQNRNEILKLLKDLKDDDKTIVIVTHDPVVGEACDRIIQMNE